VFTPYKFRTSQQKRQRSCAANFCINYANGLLPLTRILLQSTHDGQQRRRHSLRRWRNESVERRALTSMQNVVDRRRESLRHIRNKKQRLRRLNNHHSSLVSCVAQLAERRSLAGELTLSCARPSADGWPLWG